MHVQYFNLVLYHGFMLLKKHENYIVQNLYNAEENALGPNNVQDVTYPMS